MTSIRFGASTQPPLRPEELNHRTSSPFQKNQIQFHVGSTYLTDFTDEGIKRFIDKHGPSKDLNFQEVKTFIQRVAQNAEAAQNLTFDLSDPELGLYDDDKVANRHLQGAFTLNFRDKAALPEGQSRSIHFVDATAVSFDLKEREDIVSGANRKIESLQKQLNDAKDDHEDAVDDSKTAARILGPNAQAKLRGYLEEKSQIAEQIAGLDSDKARFEEEAKGLDADSPRKLELNHMLRGISAERARLVDQQKALAEKMEDTTGPLLQRYSFNELHKLNQKVATTQERITSLEAQIAEQREIARNPVPDAPKETQPAEQAAAETPAAETPAAEQAAADPAVPPASEQAAEEVAVGPQVDIEAIKQLPPNHQASRLSTLKPEEQRAILLQMQPEQRQAILSATETYLAQLKSNPVSRVRKQEQDYTVLKETLVATLNEPVTAPADKPANAEGPTAQTPTDPQPPSDPAAPPSETPAPVAPASPAPAADEADKVTVGPETNPLPPGALIKNGKPLMHQGQILTESSFMSLSIKAKFAVLMKVDSAQLKGLLVAMGDERKQIRAMAQAVVEDFERSRQNAPKGAVERNADGSSSYVIRDGDKETRISIDTSAYRNEESYQRAKEIIRLIDEIEGTSSTTQSSFSNYTLKPGDTARKVAEQNTSLFGGAWQIFEDNPELRARLTQRNVPQDQFYDQDLYAAGFRQIKVKTVQQQNPLAGVRPRREEEEPPATNPKVEIQAPAPKPAAAPASPAAPTAPVTAEPPAPAAEAPKPPAAPTAQLIDADAPAAETPKPAEPAPVETPKPTEAPPRRTTS